MDNTGATIYTMNVALKTFQFTCPLSVYIYLQVIQAELETQDIMPEKCYIK